MKNNVHYECIMGSVAYGVSNDTSDIDVYGFSMPPKHILFPYQHGYIVGFGKKPDGFDQFQKHHIKDKSRQKEYDITIYNIVRFFNLCMENNPNMVDSLFVPTSCVLHSTQIGEHVRNNRKLFLSKRVYHKFKGYAFSQLHKMKNKFIKEFVEHCKKYDIPFNAQLQDILLPIKHDNENVSRMITVVNKIETNGKRSTRIPLIAEHGYDTKFAYHVVRLLDECQMILEEGDLDLTRSKAHLKAIRKGEVSIEQIEDYFDAKMPILEELYNKSKLPYSVDEEKIKQLLIDCIEMHYENISNFIGNNNINEITRIISSGIVQIEKGISLLYKQ